MQLRAILQWQCMFNIKKTIIMKLYRNTDDYSYCDCDQFYTLERQLNIKFQKRTPLMTAKRSLSLSHPSQSLEYMDF